MEDLEYNQDFVEYALPDAPPLLILEFLSGYEGNAYVAEGGDKSNDDLYHTVHVEIPEYQYQNMNVNQLKVKLRKRKTSVWYEDIIYKILLTSLKEKSPIYVDEIGLTKNQKNKKG